MTIPRRPDGAGLLGLAACLLSLLALAAMLGGCGGWSWKPSAWPAANDLPNDELAVVDDRPPTLKTRYAMARLLVAQGRDDECETVLQQILTESPDFMPAYCYLAELQMRQQRMDDAVHTLSAGLQVDPHSAILLNNLGFCHVMKNDFAKALDFFTEAAAAMPQNARYRANMALALGMLGRYDESLALAKQILTPAEAHHNLSVICAARGDLLRAAKEQARSDALEAGTATE
jgi:Flp pilus assembly protein TadD